MYEISEAMLDGYLAVDGQNKAAFFINDDDGTFACALGCVAIGCAPYLATDPDDEYFGEVLESSLNELLKQEIIHPVYKHKLALDRVIISLNDAHEWSVYKIANWLRDNQL